MSFLCTTHDERHNGIFKFIPEGYIKMTKKKSDNKILDVRKCAHKTLTEKMLHEDIKWFYDQMGLKYPKVYIAASYEVQKNNIEKYKKSESVEAKYNDAVRNKGLTADITEDQIEELRKQYGATSENHALDKVSEVLTKNTKGSGSDQYFGIGFELFYSLNDEVVQRIKNFYRKGVFNIEYYESEIFICECPTAIRFDKEGRLHGGEKAAIAFADGNDYFLVRDVFFTSKMWKKIQGRTMSVEETLGLPNIEQRCIALEYLGPEAFLEQTKAVKLDGPTEKGNTLFSVKLKMGENRFGDSGTYEYKLLQYACTSTSRKYASFVPEDIVKADAGMAWKHKMTIEEYLKIEKET